MRSTTLVILACSLLLSACGAWQSVSDTTVSTAKAIFTRQVKVLNIDFKAREALNPDDQQRSLSVVARVYQLKDRKSLDAASYDSLLKQDKTILAQDLLDAQGIVVRPGGMASLSQPLHEDTRFVAVVVFFRQASVDADWRRVVARSSLLVDRPLKFELLGSQLISETDSLQKRP